MTDVGVGYVQLLPSMRGFSAAVSRELAGAVAVPMAQAGDAAGADLAGGVSKGVSRNESKLKGSAKKMGAIFKTALAGAGLAAGIALVGGVSTAIGQEAITDKLEAQLGGGQFAQEAGDVAGRLYGQAFGDSLGDTADAVKQVLQSGILNEDELSAGNLEALTAQALTFSDVLDQDLNMSLQAVDRMLASGLAGSAEEAFDVLTKGIQSGADRSGDLTETFQEYSTLFREIGLSASDATGLMSLGLQAGARDADKVADALKEFAIRAQDGSTLSAEGFAAMGLSAEEMTAAVARGGPEARAALDTVLDGLRGMEDPVARNAAAVALFGTQAEDLGDALFNLDLDRAGMLMHDAAGSTEGLGSAYDNAATKIESFKRRAMQTLVEFIGNRVIPALERLAEIVGPIVSAAFDWLKGIIDQIDFGGIADQATGLGAVFVPVVEAIVAFAQENLPKLGELFSSVFELIETVVQRAIDIVSFIWTNFGDEIMAAATIWWEFVSGTFSNYLDQIIGVVQLVTAILKGDWSAAGEAVKKITSAWWANVKLLFKTGLAVIKLAVKAGWSVIKATFRAGITAAATFLKSQLDRIVNWFRGFGGRIRSGISNVANIFIAPFRKAFNAIKWAWNNTVGGFGVSIPSVFGFGGASFTIPRMHTGGLFDAPGGRSEGLALLQSGERVLSRRDTAVFDSLGSARLQPAASTVVQLELVPGGDRMLLEWLRNTVRVKGRGPELVFG